MTLQQLNHYGWPFTLPAGIRVRLRRLADQAQVNSSKAERLCQINPQKSNEYGQQLSLANQKILEEANQLCLLS